MPLLPKRIGLANMNLILRGVKPTGDSTLVGIDEEDLSDFITSVPLRAALKLK
ncbi:MAG: hypothetical protein AB7H80_15920 [Candidatus Kapaibacterium sp.]